jgi:protein-S-isoprenylcysteine O-methyltransferase Ste14
VKAAIFLVISSLLIALSRHSLGSPRAHGFPRLFAFEAILLLVLLNADVWFLDPFSPLQMISWVLLAGSLLLAIDGFYLLLAFGKPKGDFEKTTVFVTRGAYRYVRHPLYSSLLLGAAGAFFKDPSLLGAFLFLASALFLVGTARREESENLQKFKEYAAYRDTTWMFLPFLF